MRIIYFHIDELNRDSVTAIVLKNELNKRNYTVVYGNRSLIKLFKYFEFVFDICILPKPLFMASYFKENDLPNLKSKYLMLYTENIGIIANNKFPKLVLKGALDEEYMSGNTSFVDKIAGFCFWGSQVHDLVKSQYSSLANKCFIVGHPRHDMRALNISKKKYNNKTIGIISRFCTVNDYFGRGMLERLVLRYSQNKTAYEYFNKNTDDYLLFKRRGANVVEDIYLECLDIKNIILIIKTLNENGFKVSYKVHPREDENTWIDLFKQIKLNVEVANSNQPFTHWATEQKYIIGPPSTSFYDCLMVGVTPISIHKLTKNRSDFVSEMFEENNKLMEHIYSPANINELIDFINMEPNNFKLTGEVHNILKTEANYPECSQSIKNLGDVIEKMLINSPKRTFKQNIFFVLYSIISSLYAHIAYIKRLLWRQKQTSSSFLLTRKNIYKINNSIN
jgi:surface carbohydrate biosynthesis protein